jgi:hypothetical protein
METIFAQTQKSFKHLSSNGIKKSVLDEFESFLTARGTLSRSSLIIRCQIARESCDVRLIVDKPISQRRLTRAFLPFLARLLDRIRGCADFFVLLSDNIYVSHDRRTEFLEFLKNVPLLRCDQRDDEAISSHSILIPDFSIQEARYADELSAIDNAAGAIAFEQRFGVIKWRGSLSGPGYPNLENYREFPRYTLLVMSRMYPEILDARLTTYGSVSGIGSADALRQRLKDMFGSPEKIIPFEDFVRYKYLISVDGAVAAWKRVPTILASGSALLLQHQWKQFFYPGLKPWVHYIPLKDDISDLIERYAWLLDHSAAVKIIAGNGQRFARQILHPKALEAYFLEVVTKCGELYRS